MKIKEQTDEQMRRIRRRTEELMTEPELKVEVQPPAPVAPQTTLADFFVSEDGYDYILKNEYWRKNAEEANGKRVILPMTLTEESAAPAPPEPESRSK